MAECSPNLYEALQHRKAWDKEKEGGRERRRGERRGNKGHEGRRRRQERGDSILELYTLIPPAPRRTLLPRAGITMKLLVGGVRVASHTSAASLKIHRDLRMDRMEAESSSCAVPNIALLFPRTS